MNEYTWADEPCDWCNGSHEGGPLSWMSCPACQGPDCPHPSVMGEFIVGPAGEFQVDVPFRCDACGELAG